LSSRNTCGYWCSPPLLLLVFFPAVVLLLLVATDSARELSSENLSCQITTLVTTGAAAVFF
jgi:hypothetical protein